MTRRCRRWLSIAVLALLAFSQAGSVLAACAMDRAALPQVLGGGMHECCDSMPADSMSANACLTHSTSDLQVLGIPALATPAPAAVAVLVVLQRDHVPMALALAPPRVVPPRILLHSFLI